MSNRRPYRSRERGRDVGRLVADTLRSARERGCTCGHDELLHVSYEPVHVAINHLDDCPLAIFDLVDVDDGDTFDCECDPATRSVTACRLAGHVIIPGAYQCTTCGKRVDESLL